MREIVIPVRLMQERVTRPRRVRSLWFPLPVGSIVDVENNRERERGAIAWMRCRVHREVDGVLWVIPLAV